MHHEPACNGQGPVVYRIRNLFNGKKYIGSTMNCASRMYYHINSLRRGKSKCLKLQRAFTKSGDDNFVFEIVEHCTKENLLQREQHYLDQRPEYNISFIAGPKTRYGLKSTPEHRANMSKALMGRISPMKGKKFTATHKQRLSDSHKGKHVGNTSRRIDLNGQTFGKWEVVSFAGKDGRGECLWMVKCGCGCRTTKAVRGSSLTSGHSRSCGSIKRNSKEWRRNANSIRCNS